MAQKTNLNISPYYDDFSKDKNFYKVLFKPGQPVQARELTTLQSTLQNQVESFGSHIFKDGSCVVPGNIAYDGQYHSIKLNPEHLGVPVSLYASNLVGKNLTGQISGVTVSVDKYFLPEDRSDITDLTLFIKYKTSGSDTVTQVLQDGESLITEESFIYGNTPINAGETVATLLTVEATHIGSAVGIATGVYFIRGNFVDVSADKIVLDPYTNTPSYRVGLNILEEIVTAKDDSTLYDNARGFTNYAAPGADRLKISTILSKKPLSDFNDKSFIELIKLDGGQIRKIDDQPQYNLIKDYFAKRTFEESGNYAVDKFDVEVQHSLNDGIGNDGVFTSKQKTDEGNTPSDDLMCVKLSPGRAYVKGYDVDKGGTTVVDVEKTREKRKLDTALISYKMGNKLRLNNVIGSPNISINTNNIVDLNNGRVTAAGGDSGDVIGKARVYSIHHADGPHTGRASEWDLYLFDVQLFTTLTINQNIGNAEMPNGSLVKGLSSGATGYSFNTVATWSGDLIQTTGKFIEGEQIIINENPAIRRSITSINVNTISDVKAVKQTTAGVTDFRADTVLQKVYVSDSESIGATFGPTDLVTLDASAKRISAPGKNFLGFKVGQIIRYQRSTTGFTTETYNKISAVAATGLSIDVTGIATVSGVCDGGVPGNDMQVPFALGAPKLVDHSTSKLYAPIDSSDVANINLANSKLIISKQITGRTVSGGNLVLRISDFAGIGSAFFEPYDPDRYSIINSNGTIEKLTEDQFVLASNGTQINFSGLTNGSNIRVNATLRKNEIQNKTKSFVRSQKLSITRSNTGVSTVTSGLTTSVTHTYGLRVEDEEISLNVPDVANVVKVLESVDTVDPILDKLSFVTGLNLDTATVLGEKIIGDDSGAIGQLVTRSSAKDVEICYLNDKKFVVGEKVTFEESAVITNLQDITPGVYLDITDHFDLDKGQREQFYDYSRLVRKKGAPAPGRRLLVVHNYYDVPSTDSGDCYTVNSYGKERFGYDVPHLKDGLRASDTLDFRPRVPKFTATNSSPFFFNSRDFSLFGGNPPHVVKSGEGSVIGYEHYLPRIDKVVLSTSGEFMVTKGVASIDPQVPETNENSMHIATVRLPAYLYDPKLAKISLVDNKRFTMRDIGKIEDRVQNLEILTSLSLLELETKSFDVKDSEGLNRFKTGFFVDDFKDVNLMETGDKDCTCDVDVARQELNAPFDRYSIKPELALDPSIDPTTADFTANLTLLDSANLRKTGDMITLNYDEVESEIKNLQASRVENVNPFNIVVFEGGITLNPASDTWVRNVVIPGGERTTTGPADGSFVTEVRISSEPDTHIRSRNVGFSASGLKPFTRYYPFFDSQSGLDIIPKVVEVIMTRGIFTAGETVQAFAPGGRQVASFRIARPNHKSGDINNPAVLYSKNPYDITTTLPDSYSASSTTLNVDIASLADETQGRFWGYLPTGNDVVLVGESSNAEAVVDNLRLVSDTFGDVNGAFFFRNPLATPTPSVRFTIGSKTFKLSTSSTNSENLVGQPIISTASTRYMTSGIVDTFEQSTVQIRMPPPPPIPIIINNTFVTNNIIGVTEENVRQLIREMRPAPRRDPLAQTFRIRSDEYPSGVFMSSLDIYLGKRDETQPITVQLRTVELGLPTEILVADYTNKTFYPTQTTDGLPKSSTNEYVLRTSSDASIPTRVTWDSPIYLNPDTDYAIVLLAPTSNNYEAWIARMGDKTVDTQSLPDGESAIVTRQYLNGSLFKSQNGSTWTPSQFEDLKFKINKCKFISNLGTLTLYNPSLGKNNSIVQRLLPNPIKTLPRKLRVGIDTISTSMSSDILSIGTKVTEGSQTPNRGPFGFIEDVGGQCKSISLPTTVGTGYEASQTVNNVGTYAITGGGEGLIVNTETNGSGEMIIISLASGISSGTGYKSGDLIGIQTSTLTTPKGSGATFTINTTGRTDTLFLTNVQGKEFSTGGHIKWFNGNTASAGSATTTVTSSVVVGLNSGNVVEVEHYNHGINADNNWVTLADIQPDTSPVKLNADLAVDAGTISVASTSEFTTFEGITTTTGFVQINGEIIYYNGVGVGELSIGGRAINNSLKRTHKQNDLAYKYELNGISLTGINTTHDLASMDLNVIRQRENDKLFIQVPLENRQHLDNRGDASQDNMLGFTDEQFVGGDNVFSSQNLQYNAIIPQFGVITPGDTTIASSLRSVSGTSSGGSEASFIDQGFEDIQLNNVNRLESPRLLSSEINETKRLEGMPKNKSVTLNVQLNSVQPDISPMIDIAQDATIIYERSRLNKPVIDYTVDSRSNSISGDPHSGVYISKRIDLKQTASSLKLIVSAYRDSSADFRALYQLYRDDSDEVVQTYDLFPGYNNLRDDDGDGFGDTVRDLKNNSGLPDVKVPASKLDEFFEYQFSADNLTPFSGFRIKIVMSGTNEARAPKFKDLRVIALA